MTNKIYTLIFCTLILLSTNSCLSTNEKPGPFLTQELTEKGLITESVEDNSEIRIVYPSIAQEEYFRSLIDKYINLQPEIQSFISLGKKRNQQTESPGVYKLSIYIYEIANRQNIISLVFEAEYNAATQNKFSNWYTLNFDTANNSAVALNSLFENQDGALAAISNFVKLDLSRQKKLRQININNDAFIKLESRLFVNLLSSFVFVPSIQKPNVYAGLRIYLNQASNENEGKYASNIPTSVFKSFLKKEYQTKFIEEPLPLITEDPVHTRATTFPDLAQ